MTSLMPFWYLYCYLWTTSHIDLMFPLLTLTSIWQLGCFRKSKYNGYYSFSISEAFDQTTNRNPANTYKLKVKYKCNWKRCEIHSKLTTKLTTKFTLISTVVSATFNWQMFAEKFLAKYQVNLIKKPLK